MSGEGRNSELYYHMALALVNGVGPVMGKSLIAYCGSAEAVFTEKKSRLSKIPNIGSTSAASIFSFRDFDVVDKELAFIEKNKIRAIHFSSPDYPIRLKQEMDSPLVLFVKGNTNLNHGRTLAIVGTRKNTVHGADITRQIVASLKPYDIHTVSGLAYGIDIIAHRASMDNQIPTVAVVAHGLDIIYPANHLKYAEKMIENGGAIVTEHFSGTALNADLFPRRNRIVAAMCDGILVVESQTRGGSMITADIASGYNRDVFAVPGRPGDSMSEGCNILIKSLKAALCENATDIVQSMNWEIQAPKTNPPNLQTSLFIEMDDDEKAIAKLLQAGNQAFDNILFNTGMPLSKINFLLLNMEMKGIIESLPGKSYRLCT